MLWSGFITSYGNLIHAYLTMGSLGFSYINALIVTESTLSPARNGTTSRHHLSSLYATAARPWSPGPPAPVSIYTCTRTVISGFVHHDSLAHIAQLQGALYTGTTYAIRGAAASVDNVAEQQELCSNQCCSMLQYDAAR
jgi:hypothetical protein